MDNKRKRGRPSAVALRPRNHGSDSLRLEIHYASWQTMDEPPKRRINAACCARTWRSGTQLPRSASTSTFIAVTSRHEARTRRAVMLFLSVFFDMGTWQNILLRENASHPSSWLAFGDLDFLTGRRKSRIFSTFSDVYVFGTNTRAWVVQADSRFTAALTWKKDWIYYRDLELDGKAHPQRRQTLEAFILAKMTKAKPTEWKLRVSIGQTWRNKSHIGGELRIPFTDWIEEAIFILQK